MSLMPQIKGTFIKMKCFKTKPCPSQMKMTRVHGSVATGITTGRRIEKRNGFKKDLGVATIVILENYGKP